MQLPTAPPPRYRIEHSLGQGGLGEVFLAFDGRLRRNVAIKRLSAEAAGDNAPYKQAWQEAVYLASIQHPNVVTVYDFGTDSHGPFLVMELVTGETLEAVVARGAFPLNDFLPLARQTLEGLAAAHQAGLLHHDLKPGNIMLKHGPTDALQVKILDFGIARYSTKLEVPATDILEPAARNILLGTIEFMAPELFERKPFTQRGELYSLGCIFYYALTGLDPFRGDTTDEVIASHLRGCPTPLQTLRRDLPHALLAWVMRLINRRVEDRPASVQQALSELEQLFVAPIARVGNGVEHTSIG